MERIKYTCPLDGHELQSQPDHRPDCQPDLELVSKVQEYIRKNPNAFPQPATAVQVQARQSQQPANKPRVQPRPVARSRASCPPGLAIAGGLFLLSAIAYAVNQLCFAGASAVLGVIGFPASLVIIPVVYLLQQLVQLLVALAEAASGAAAAI